MPETDAVRAEETIVAQEPLLEAAVPEPVPQLEPQSQTLNQSLCLNQSQS